jgi:hypothetical protein
MYMSVTFASAKVYWTWLAKWFLAMMLWSLVRLCDLGYMVLGIFQIVFHNILIFLCLRNCSSSHHSLPYWVFLDNIDKDYSKEYISVNVRDSKRWGGETKYHCEIPQSCIRKLQCHASNSPLIFLVNMEKRNTLMASHTHTTFGMRH